MSSPLPRVCSAGRRCPATVAAGYLFHRLPVQSNRTPATGSCCLLWPPSAPTAVGRYRRPGFTAGGRRRPLQPAATAGCCCWPPSAAPQVTAVATCCCRRSQLPLAAAWRCRGPLPPPAADDRRPAVALPPPPTSTHQWGHRRCLSLPPSCFTAAYAASRGPTAAFASDAGVCTGSAATGTAGRWPRVVATAATVFNSAAAAAAARVSYKRGLRHWPDEVALQRRTQSTHLHW